MDYIVLINQQISLHESFASVHRLLSNC